MFIYVIFDGEFIWEVRVLPDVTASHPPINVKRRGAIVSNKIDDAIPDVTRVNHVLTNMIKIINLKKNSYSYYFKFMIF